MKTIQLQQRSKDQTVYAAGIVSPLFFKQSLAYAYEVSFASQS
ncbi:hypothetical protein [Paenibacillus segetis]|nr:hypothetical protein [Paenibacillus segetis]